MSALFDIWSAEIKFSDGTISNRATVVVPHGTAENFARGELSSHNQFSRDGFFSPHATFTQVHRYRTKAEVNDYLSTHPEINNHANYGGMLP